jgi:hypothetical protein
MELSDWFTLGKKKLLYPLQRRLDGPQGRNERNGEEINFLSLLGFLPQTFQPVA